MENAARVLDTPAPSDGTEALIERALRGEQQARRALVEGLANVVRWEVRGALERCGRGRHPDSLRQESEDLVQEVFCGLFHDDARALRLWRPTGGRSLANFVRWYARRQAISILRTGKRNPWTEQPTPDEALEECVGGGVDPLAMVEARDLIGALLDQLASVLGPEQLRLFELAYVDELSPADIIGELGLAPDAVYQRLKRLRDQVRRIAEALVAEQETNPAGGDGHVRR
jgi:RNA polymerase sigma-70 factor (ECF subfamily)